jgi:hypothetical protein
LAEGALLLADTVAKFPMKQAASVWVGKYSAVHFGPSMGEPKRQRFQQPYLSVSSGIPPKSCALLIPADYAEFAPLVLEYALAKDSLAVAIVQEAAEAATRIIERLKDVGCPAISLIGGLAEPLMEWLPTHVRRLLSAAQCDPLDGAILMARRGFFRLESLTLRAG